MSRLPVSFLLSALLLSCKPSPPAPLIDDAGRGVELRATPRRIVTLAPNLTEMVVAAGGESLLVATDNFSNHPPSVRSLPKVGDMQPNAELIARLRPDLVFTVSSATHPILARSLQNAGIPLFVVKADRLADVPRAIVRLGEVLQTEPVANAAAAALRRELQSHRRTRPRTPRVLFVVWLDPLYVAGRETFVDDLIELAGGRNSVEASGWPQYSLESLAASPPDLIVLASRARSDEQLAAFFQKNSPWKEMSAVQGRFWYVVDEDRFARPGPRVSEAAADLNRVIDQWELKQ